MPYPFAHPAAVLPLVGPMGRFGVTSALVIGSMVPDAWYLVPGLVRVDSHSAAGLFWFCLPAGLLAYLAWQFFRQKPLSEAPWYAVIVSVIVGAATHVAWDALTHSVAYRGHYVLQHASTVLGTAFIAWWCYRRLWIAAMAGAALAAAGAALLAVSAEVAALRSALREAGVAAAWILGASLVAWRLISARATAPRAPRAPSPRTPGR
jgi:hypothetical protein